MVRKILEIIDENSIEKLNFYLFLGKVVAKYIAFGKNIIFLKQFVPVQGGLNPPLTCPAYATVFHAVVEIIETFKSFE